MRERYCEKKNHLELSYTGNQTAAGLAAPVVSLLVPDWWVRCDRHVLLANGGASYLRRGDTKPGITALTFWPHTITIVATIGKHAPRTLNSNNHKDTKTNIKENKHITEVQTNTYQNIYKIKLHPCLRELYSWKSL